MPIEFQRNWNLFKTKTIENINYIFKSMIYAQNLTAEIFGHKVKFDLNNWDL
jgi:hypothetical protein